MAWKEVKEKQMTGWNMPPGCNIRDIPGNSAEDQKAEAAYDAIYELLDPLHIDEGERERVADAFYKMLGAAYHEGYQAGQDDERMAQHTIRANLVRDLTE